jgi:ABC-type glycerol-3-phosphate transport system substrate-binding protein
MTLTVWLMPNEPAADVGPKAGIDAEVKRFNEDLKRQSVTVLNTSDDYLRQQLLNWNPEFAVPSWGIIQGQSQTLRALGSFARKNGVAIRVLIVNWSQAFGDLQRALEGAGDSRLFPPDVAQVGSTWVAHFAKIRSLLAPSEPSQTGGLDWRSLPDHGKVTLRYIHDVRLLFYWKRLPDEPPTTKPFVLNTESWETILDSLKKEAQSGQAGKQRPPMAMPIGLGLWLLHDYAPLVWAGGGAFLSEGSTKVDLASREALHVPLLLARQARQLDRDGLPYRIVAFPETSHEDTLGYFVDGRYLAVIEPVAFLRRWHTHFRKHKARASFWDYCGVAVPPSPFKGGSDLMVTRHSRHPDLAFQLAHFLASDKEHQELFVRHGVLPAQPGADRDHGIQTLLGQLQPPGPRAVEIRNLIRRAVTEGREYPNLPDWARGVESPEILERLQRLWRRIGEGGADEHRVVEAAQEVQSAINLNIDTPTQVRAWLERWGKVGLLIGFCGMTVATLVLAWRARVRKREARALAERNAALDEVRRVRNFTSTALWALEAEHGIGLNQKQKGRIIRAELLGLRRGMDDTLWKECALERILWNAVILAIEPSGDLFREWESTVQSSPGLSPQAFLKQQNLLRESPEPFDGCGFFFFDIRGAETRMVPTPAMLEHALVCLLQNAIRASTEENNRYCGPIFLSHDPGSDTVSIRNEGLPISPVLCRVLNESRDIEQFAGEVEHLLDGSIDNRPGIGFVAAYCITRQCYGGLTVESTPPKVSVHLTAARQDCKP